MFDVFSSGISSIDFLSEFLKRVKSLNMVSVEFGGNVIIL